MRYLRPIRATLQFLIPHSSQTKLPVHVQLVQINHGDAGFVHFVGADEAAVPLNFVVGVGVAGVHVLGEGVVVAF